MTFQEKLLHHHGHPAKLAIDVTAALAAGVLIWQQHLLRAIAVGVVLPAIVPAFVLWFADVQKRKNPAIGPYEARETTWPMVITRIAAAFLFWGGAWYRSTMVCTLALIVIAVTWVRVPLVKAR